MAGLRDLGPAAANARLHVGMMLQYRNERELESLVAAQGDPASPIYHHFLTSEQFAARYGPTPEQYARALVSLRQNGFTIDRTYPNRTVIDAEAGASTVNRYFQTSIHRVAQAGYGVRYANATEAKAPVDIADLVRGVTGLHTLRTMHTLNERAKLSAIVRPDAKLQGAGLLFGPDGGYGPLAYTTAYHLPASSGSVNGKGQSSGVVIDADFLDSDIVSFLEAFQISRTGHTYRKLVDGGPPSGLIGDSVETELDVETILGIAPATNLYVYEFPSFDSNQYILDSYEQVVSDNKVATANSSFGGCETFSGDDSPQLYDLVALQGASLGITFHASSGDAGADSCSGLGVLSPASSPHFTAVGGTSLYIVPKTLKLQGELGWDGSGGGTSVLFSTPTYQQGVPGISGGGRELPDVSFDADPQSGASLFFGGLFQGPIGGTSLSSPIFGGSLAIVNQLEGQRQGFINPRIYSTYKTYGYGGGANALFRDITVGSNGVYSAKPGYDEVTGIGPILFQQFAPIAK